MKRLFAILLIFSIAAPASGYDGAILNYNFSAEQIGWDSFHDADSVELIEENENSMLKIDGGRKIVLNRSVKNFKGSFIVSFKIRAQNRTVRVYARDYRYMPVLLFEITPDTQQIISVTATIDGSLCKTDGGLVFKLPDYLTDKGICGLQIEFENENSVAYIDDIRMYEGTEILDEYQLLSSEEKADVKMKNALVFVRDYYKAAIYGEVKSLQPPIERDGILYVPYTIGEAAFEENAIGYTAADLLGNVFFGDNGLIIISNEVNIFDKENSDDMQIAALITKRVRNIDYYTVDGKQYALTSTPEGEEIPVEKISATSSDANIAPWAIDGSLDSRWSGAGNPSLTLDLGKAYDIGSLAIAWYSGDKRRAYYSIEISDDGENWTEVIKDAKSSGKSSLYEIIPFGKSARYIRYNGRGSDISEWNSILEFKLFK